MIVTDNLLRQTCLHFPRFEEAEVKISPIDKGGSGRKFYRIRFSPDQTVVLVKYTRDQAENQRYVEIAEFLAAHAVRAPKIYFHDSDEGLIWIEDLGEKDLWSYREEHWPTRRPLYESALAEAAKLHRIPLTEAEGFESHLPAQFDAALYLWEQYYFFENCLGRYFGATQSDLQKLAGLPQLEKIAQDLADYPRVLIHRDFQSQNVIVREGQACLIDFQGLRPGLAEYDVASLLYDPYVDLSDEEREELATYYEAQNPVAEAGFAERLRFCTMQRLMQALGAYGYLGLVIGKKEFLTHIPAALHSLGEVLDGVDGLGPLRNLIRDLARAQTS